MEFHLQLSKTFHSFFVHDAILFGVCRFTISYVSIAWMLAAMFSDAFSTLHHRNHHHLNFIWFNVAFL